MGYRLNRLDEPVFMAVPKPMLTEFGIHYRLESCAHQKQKHAGPFLYKRLLLSGFFAVNGNYRKCLPVA